MNKKTKKRMLVLSGIFLALGATTLAANSSDAVLNVQAVLNSAIQDIQKIYFSSGAVKNTTDPEIPVQLDNGTVSIGGRVMLTTSGAGNSLAITSTGSSLIQGKGNSIGGTNSYIVGGKSNSIGGAGLAQERSLSEWRDLVDLFSREELSEEEVTDATNLKNRLSSSSATSVVIANGIRNELISDSAVSVANLSNEYAGTRTFSASSISSSSSPKQLSALEEQSLKEIQSLVASDFTEITATEVNNGNAVVNRSDLSNQMNTEASVSPSIINKFGKWLEESEATFVGTESAGADMSAIIGGKNNKIVQGKDLYIIGGEKNRIYSGQNSFIIGGKGNHILGNNAYILMGSGSKVTANDSVAIGNNIVINHDRVFAWGDSRGEKLTSAQEGTFIINALNGVNIIGSTTKPKFTATGAVNVDGIIQVADESVKCGPSIQGAVQFTGGQYGCFCGCNGQMRKWVSLVPTAKCRELCPKLNDNPERSYEGAKCRYEGSAISITEGEACEDGTVSGFVVTPDSTNTYPVKWTRSCIGDDGTTTGCSVNASVIEGSCGNGCVEGQTCAGTRDVCSSGTPVPGTVTNGVYRRECHGVNTGQYQKCSICDDPTKYMDTTTTPIQCVDRVNGACLNETNTYACNPGKITGTGHNTTTHTLTWSCESTSGGGKAEGCYSCDGTENWVWSGSAKHCVEKKDGVCNNEVVRGCSQGTASQYTNVGNTHTWYCEGINGGKRSEESCHYCAKGTRDGTSCTEEIATTFTIKYNCGENGGTMEDQIVNCGEPFKLNMNTCIKTGFTMTERESYINEDFFWTFGNGDSVDGDTFEDFQDETENDFGGICGKTIDMNAVWVEKGCGSANKKSYTSTPGDSLLCSTGITPTEKKINPSNASMYTRKCETNYCSACINGMMHSDNCAGITHKENAGTAYSINGNIYPTDSSWKYGTLTVTDGNNSITIMDRNIGASAAGTGIYVGTLGVTPCPSTFGYYYRWGNEIGFKCNASTSSMEVKDNNTYWSMYNRGNWENYAQSQVVSPCPSGYHVPTKNEWDSLESLWFSMGGKMGGYANSDGYLGNHLFMDDFLIPSTYYKDINGYGIDKSVGWGETIAYLRTSSYRNAQGISDPYKLVLDRTHRYTQGILNISDQCGGSDPGDCGDMMNIRCFKD